MTTDQSTTNDRLREANEHLDHLQIITEVFFIYLNSKHFRKECKERRRNILRHIWKCVYNL